MIVYSKTKRDFLEDIHLNRIDLEILATFKDCFGRAPGASEINSWRNSMQYMSHQVAAPGIPADVGVAIEFTIPLTSKRVDFILTGTDEQDRDVAVIIELKQWSAVELTGRDAIVRTFVGGAERDIAHPSYQAWTYAKLIHDYNETVRNEDIQLVACAYCHNLRDRTAVNDARYTHHLARAPVFISDDAEKLAQFIQKHVRYGDKRQLMHRIDKGRIRPSKNLADLLKGLLAKQSELVLVDEQKVVYERALELASIEMDQKRVIVVQGGPGTGKSVVALNLLAELTSRGLLAQYVSKNAAPRSVFAEILRGTKTRSQIDSLFRGSGAFTDVEPDFFDVLLVDEAHRLNAKSGLYSNLGENQVKELIKAAKTVVFFLDEDQRIAIHDIGSSEEIHKWAAFYQAQVVEGELPSQFRCDGSDGYLAFLDNTLGIRDTANQTISRDEYDFRVFDDPMQLWDEIRALNHIRNRARLVAGYCWEWRSKKHPELYDINFPDYAFAARWNLTGDGSLWILADDSVEEVGCIHTCQGLELDYVGVILGPDFLVRDGRIVTNGFAHPGRDKTLYGFRKRYKADPSATEALADRLIRNTYRTLMTRGMKGCFIYSPDKETAEYFRTRIRTESACADAWSQSSPLPILNEKAALGLSNIVPVSMLTAPGDAPGVDSLTRGWVQLPVHFNALDGMFVAQVITDAARLRTTPGAWCLFRLVATKASAADEVADTIENYGTDRQVHVAGPGGGIAEFISELG